MLSYKLDFTFCMIICWVLTNPVTIIIAELYLEELISLKLCFLYHMDAVGNLLK